VESRSFSFHGEVNLRKGGVKVITKVRLTYPTCAKLDAACATRQQAQKEEALNIGVVSLHAQSISHVGLYCVINLDVLLGLWLRQLRLLFFPHSMTEHLASLIPFKTSS
jgi:hypothetical protein